MKLTYYFLTLLLLSSCMEADESSDDDFTLIPPPLSTAKARWLSASNLTLKISTDFSSEEKTAVEDMMNQWNQLNSSVGMSLSSTNTPTTSFDSLIEYYTESQPVFGIYKSGSGRWYDELSSNALAITQYFYKVNSSGSETFKQLIHADIIFNTRDHKFHTSSPQSDSYDLATVALHELGHFIGLGHYYGVEPSVMEPSLSLSEVKQSPNPIDASVLSELYDGITFFSLQSALSIENDEKEKDEKVYQGWIELRNDNHCYHYENGILKYSHEVNSK